LSVNANDADVALTKLPLAGPDVMFVPELGGAARAGAAVSTKAATAGTVSKA
jgi:hypothetical protein